MFWNNNGRLFLHSSVSDNFLRGGRGMEGGAAVIHHAGHTARPRHDRERETEKVTEKQRQRENERDRERVNDRETGRMRERGERGGKGERERQRE